MAVRRTYTTRLDLSAEGGGGAARPSAADLGREAAMGERLAVWLASLTPEDAEPALAAMDDAGERGRTAVRMALAAAWLAPLAPAATSHRRDPVGGRVDTDGDLVVRIPTRRPRRTGWVVPVQRDWTSQTV